MKDDSPPLAGITVVALEQAVAAPLATRHLADLGARVIKVERPEGDFARRYDDAVDGLSSHFVWLNRGKESVVLDLKTERGCEALERLVERADVFVHNLAPGSVERLGFGTTSVRERWPQLIICAISGYGLGGGYQHRKAYDLLVQAEVGMIEITGTPDTPSKVGVSIADIAAGMYAFSGIQTALLRRALTGSGSALAVSLFDSLCEWMGFPAYFAAYGGAPPQRSGATHATIAPYGPFATAEGDVVFVAVQNEMEWRRLCEHVLMRPELADDARFAGNVARVRNRKDLHRTMTATLGSLTTRVTIDRLEAARIAYAEQRSVADLLSHPAIAGRDRVTTVGSPVGPLWALLPPVTSDAWSHVLGAVPSLGEHTAGVLAEIGLAESIATEGRYDL